ncbi:ArsR/SmtB family transcription factor [Actinocatenispora sera]|uniref:Transcriptional regulator n=1 Tax=Actinocatenispora sera TaxID=390989 RepID=A0A810LDF3_9ACTN|nr:helix-turn-helix domain-containing protein [Actinocatenispora sera]BCJ31988.1 transcriptional regulator [Actinocatenispora sera]
MSLESGSADRPDTRPRLYDNPLAIRALAHPTRLSLYLLLGRDGPITAAEAGRQLDISQALASHHLRQLAKYGFVVPAEPGDGRERPWRVASTSFGLSDVAHDPELAAAGGVLDEVLVERALANLLDWNTRRADWDPAWYELTGTGHSLVYLTREELAEFIDGMQALVAPLVERRRIGDRAARPDDAVPVDITYVVTPLPPTENGG